MTDTLRDALAKYGLPEEAGLEGLIRHIEANRALTHEADRHTIDLLSRRIANQESHFRAALKAGADWAMEDEGYPRPEGAAPAPDEDAYVAQVLADQGQAKQTDQQRLIALLDDLGINYEVRDRDHPYNKQTCDLAVVITTSEPNQGYAGFECEFDFDAQGRFIVVGVWE